MPSKSIIIKEKILGIFGRYTESLLNICESEIEKQLFSLFLQYIFEDIYGNEKFPRSGFRKGGTFEDNKFTSITKIYDWVDWIHMEHFEIEEYLKRGYSYWESELFKAIGIQFEDENYHTPDYKTTYKLIPQYEVQLEKKFRLDFALLSSHSNNKELFKEMKVAIECDGFEFHSAKEHLTNDNIKNRMLQLSGWKIYRMSGSEIFSVKNLKQVDNIFKELRTLSYK